MVPGVIPIAQIPALVQGVGVVTSAPPGVVVRLVMPLPLGQAVLQSSAIHTVGAPIELFVVSAPCWFRLKTTVGVALLVAVLSWNCAVGFGVLLVLRSGTTLAPKEIVSGEPVPAFQLEPSYLSSSLLEGSPVVATATDCSRWTCPDSVTTPVL